MTGQRHSPASYRPITLGLPVFVFGFALVLLCIWIFFPGLKEFSAGSMKVNTCLGLLSLSGSLLLLNGKKDRTKLVTVFTLAALAIGLTTVCEYVFGLRGMIDELFVRDFPSPESSLYPGRMSPIAAILFVFCGTGLFLKTRKGSVSYSGVYFFYPAFIISSLSLLGYIYGHSQFYQFRDFIRISWQTALCFNLISVAVFFRRHRNQTAILTSSGPGGHIARRLLPVVMFTPVIFGYVWVVARRNDWVDREMGVSLFVILTISILIIVITIIARQLDRLEEKKKEIESSEEKIRNVFVKILNSSPLGLWVLDKDGFFTVCEGAGVSNLRWKKEDFIGKNYFELNAGRPYLLSNIRRAYAGETVTDQIEFDGRYFNSNYSPIYDAGGEVIGVTGISLDITDLKRAQNAVMMEQKNVRELFTHSPQIFGILRAPDFVFEFVNPGLIRLYGFDPTGMTVKDARPEAADSTSLLEHIIRTGEYVHKDEVKISVNGEPRWINMTWAPRRDDTGAIDGILFLGLDISEQVLAKEELKKAIAARDEFLSIASHELRTPITSFSLQLQVMSRLRSAGDQKAYDPTRINQLIDLGSRQLSRIGRLVDDMLDIARINTGKLSFRMEEHSLTATLKEVAERMRPLFEQQGTELSVNISGEVSLRMDQVRIEQVLINILTNALRYGEKKPVSLELIHTDDSAVITVRDQGMGIAGHFLEKVFNRFERGVNENEISGLGLGLFISKEIVDAHGGKIEAHSEGAGKGTQVRITLPLRK